MPRKSEAALSIVQPRVNARLEYVSPPSNMPANHKRIFIDLVHSMPPDDVPLLARQVAAVAMCEHAAER